MRDYCVTLNRGGTDEKTVDLRTWDFPDLSHLALMSANANLSQAIEQLHETMTSLITAVREDEPLPSECFVPDLWKYRKELTAKDGWEMFELATGTASWICGHYFKSYSHVTRNGIEGTLFTLTESDYNT
jgi:hypothetical protein